MDEDDNDEIAAAMGFASFGGTKKRKFDRTNSPKAKAAADASGANSTKLGVRTKTMESAEEAEVPDAPADSFNQMSYALSYAQLGSAPKPAGSSGMAEFLVLPQSLPEKPPGTVDARAHLARIDQSNTEMLSFGGLPISRAELNALRNGVRNENGDTIYFLPSFVEDPWAKLKGGGRA
jgi:hypothetical protein